MRPTGMRKTRVPCRTSVMLHRECDICFPTQKSMQTRARQDVARAVRDGLNDLQDEEDAFWQEFEEDQRRWNAP